MKITNLFAALSFIFSVSVASAVGSEIENWDKSLLASEVTTYNHTRFMAQNMIMKLAPSRSCKGKIVRLFLLPGSIHKNRNEESFTVNYQLSFNQQSCTNKMLVTCHLDFVNRNQILAKQNHRCESVTTWDDSNDSQLDNQNSEYPDSTDDGSSHTINNDDDDPRRSGSDFDGSASADF